MKENWLERVENGIIRLFERYEQLEENVNEMRKAQVQTHTGLDLDMLAFFLKMKVVSFVPKKWQGDVQKVLFS